jgi:protein-L-isoaspartate(D-aspartate) O-methyltransferase
MKRILAATLLIAGASLLAGCPGNDEVAETPVPDAVDWEELRERMVERIADDGVEDEGVLDAMRAVERHRFVDRRLRRRAYELNPLPIGDGQTISSPYIVAHMTEMLELTGGEKVLEIGTGSGYQAAVLAQIVPHVFTIEIRRNLADSARERLENLGIDNVTVECGNGYLGLPDEAPFDAIIVTAAPEKVPQKLVEQLKPGGVLVAPVGREGGTQTLIRVRKDEDGNITRERGTRVIFVPMIDGD